MLIMKFGGASVAAPESFLKIAEIIIEQADAHEAVVVVVSAMGNATDQLFKLAYQVNQDPPRRELDMLVSAGERISIALLAMALAAKGREAVSFTGSQSGIITDDVHSEARIIDVRPHRIANVLKLGKIAIVAGFQGVSRSGEITTLGRGGSDTTAVALAIALNSPSVVFYKDVPGIFDADPKQNPHARLIPKISYEQAYALALQGAKVLQGRSIALAEKNGIVLSIRSFDRHRDTGTIVGEEGCGNLSEEFSHKTGELLRSGKGGRVPCHGRIDGLLDPVLKNGDSLKLPVQKSIYETEEWRHVGSTT